MDDQPKFERLRQTCSATLHLFITEAQKTEAHVQQLNIPVSLVESRRLSIQRRVENVAHENYVLASMQLHDFLRQYLYIVN